MGKSSRKLPTRATWLLGSGAILVLWRSGALARVAGAALHSRAFTGMTGALDRTAGWHRLPLPLGLLTLMGLRTELRRRNLHDTTTTPPAIPAPPGDGRHLVARTIDGSFNDLARPAMGRAGTRFGRNVPLESTHPERAPAVLTPSPRAVSLTLLTRDTFRPATTLNLLAAAWIQFMVRDWFSHGPSPKEDPWEIPLAAADPWPERPMRILRTRPDPSRTDADVGRPPTHMNTETHWWDASQLYGSTPQAQALVRSGRDGKLRVGPDGQPPRELLDQAGQVPGWWLGLALLTALFTREHNAICDRLRAEYPAWPDDDLFDHARLINAALLAKIHTVEWTTAILGHPTLQVAMRGNWWGLEMERLHRLVGRLSDSEVLSGIPGGPTDHFGVPYAMTEEFVAVYKMHPLIPDDYALRSATDDTLLHACEFPAIAGPHAQEVLDAFALPDLFYSFGIAHPGAITLHNYPRHLQHLRRPDGFVMDLAATDILRARELGVPRYNQFRRLLHRPAVASFEELTDNPVWREELRRVYDNDIERVDLLVGLYAERPPAGFGFGDTAFRIFILMASRRLNSDRFFTVDYTPQVYTQAGLDWIADNDMRTVLLRHHPALAPALRGVRNAFAPWTRAER